MARYCSPQLSVRTRLSPPYRVTIRLKVFQGRNSISWAKSVLPVFIGDSRDHPGSLLRLQIVDTAFRSETRKTPGAQSRSPSVNRTAMFDIPKREVWEAYKRVKAKQGAAGLNHPLIFIS